MISKALSTTRGLITALIMVSCTTNLCRAADVDSTISGDTDTQIAQTHLGLYLCASHAYEYLRDTPLGDNYRVTAEALYDQTLKSGWTPDTFAGATLTAQENLKKLEYRPDDSLKEFKSRHFSGAPCQKYLERADHFISDSNSIMNQ